MLVITGQANGTQIRRVLKATHQGTAYELLGAESAVYKCAVFSREFRRTRARGIMSLVMHDRARVVWNSQDQRS